MKTHNVLWLGYLPEEGQAIFCGSESECAEYVSKQSDFFMHEIAPMTAEEIRIENQTN